MQNIPMFTSEYGVAGLILESVPYRQEAYIRIQSTQEPEKLLEECVKFCASCGAERIYATGHPVLEKYPLHTALWQMRSDIHSIGNTDAALWPVQPDTAARFREIYNKKAEKLPNSVWMDEAEEKEMLKEGDGYFVHQDGQLLGIGRVKGEEIRFLGSVQPGAGETVLRALTHAITGERVSLEVASVNHKAIALYERLGFIKTAELSRWYKIK